ncbi:unnamed protein product [marine sediment metagenome]|uniref:Uncharacterized protein n=1 Tax=marine sediment metagenome TaxID=412755 RepID=X0YLD9_9ZZZZ
MNSSVLDFIDFVSRLPLSDEQKVEFVRLHINESKKRQDEVFVNKDFFQNVVLEELKTELVDA